MTEQQILALFDVYVITLGEANELLYGIGADLIPTPCREWDELRARESMAE